MRSRRCSVFCHTHTQRHFCGSGDTFGSRCHLGFGCGCVSMPQPGSLLSFSLPSPVLPAQTPGSELGHLKRWHTSHSITPSRGQWCWKAERGFRWAAGGAHVLGHCSWASQTPSLTAHSLYIQFRVCATWGPPNCYFKYNASAWMRSIKEECK